MEPKVQDIVDELQQRVVARRLHGDYPPGMETELETEFATFASAARRHELDDDDLARRMLMLSDAVDRVSGTGGVNSRVPGGAVVHKSTGRLVGRHTNHVAHGVREVGQSTLAVLAEVERLLHAQHAEDERQLTEVVSGVIDRLGVIDELVSAMRSIEQRVLKLERAQHDDHD